jgi:hypothetical protein
VGYVPPTHASPFLADRGGLPAIPAPFVGEEEGFILSWAWLSSRVRRACVGPVARAPSLGSPASSRRQPCESTVRWASQAHLCSAPSVSHALDGLLLALPCGLVSSRCHVQASRFRGFLPRPVRFHLVGGPCLLAVGAVSCRRLPGDAGVRRVDLEAFSQAGIRSVDGGVSSGAARVPSCASAPSGSLRQSWGRGERPLRSRSWSTGARSAPVNEPSASRFETISRLLLDRSLKAYHRFFTNCCNEVFRFSRKLIDLLAIAWINL